MQRIAIDTYLGRPFSNLIVYRAGERDGRAGRIYVRSIGAPFRNRSNVSGRNEISEHARETTEKTGSQGRVAASMRRHLGW
jgi:hypothetical protein